MDFSVAEVSGALSSWRLCLALGCWVWCVLDSL